MRKFTPDYRYYEMEDLWEGDLVAIDFGMPVLRSPEEGNEFLRTEGAWLAKKFPGAFDPYGRQSVFVVDAKKGRRGFGGIFTGTTIELDFKRFKNRFPAHAFLHEVAHIATNFDESGTRHGPAFMRAMGTLVLKFLGRVPYNLYMARVRAYRPRES